MTETRDEYNTKLIDEFRANGGRVGGGWEGTPLLLLHHTGSKSGLGRVNPLAYLSDDTRYLVWAANGGALRNPAWYHNLKSHPDSRIEVGTETMDVVAEEVTGEERDRLFARAGERYPSLAEMGRHTERIIPLIALTPRPSRSLPAVVDRAVFETEVDTLRAREKAHTREGDAIAAARRRLPMVEVDANLRLTGPQGPLTLLDAFEGRRQLIAYYFMWAAGRPAPEQCEGCTWVTTQVTELSYLHSRDITYAVFCQGPFDESLRYHDFMGWEMPWYSAQGSLDALLVGRQIGLFHLVCYVRDGDRVFETYWTKRRGAEAMDYSYALMDLTVYGRQEAWEDSPAGWPQRCTITRSDAGAPAWPPAAAWPGGRPIAQWPRLDAGRSDDLTAGRP